MSWPISSRYSNKKFKIFAEEITEDKVVYYFQNKKEEEILTKIPKENLLEKYEELQKEGSSKPRVLLETDKEVILTTEFWKDKEVDSIKPGLYKIKINTYDGVELRQLEPLVSDEYVDLSGIFSDVEKEMQEFFDKEQDYKALGLNHRKSLLFWGPPGTGKTSLIKQAVRKYENKCLIIYLPTRITSSLLEPLTHLKDYKKIFILEEITENSVHDINNLLRFLDGDMSLDHSLVLATTNYPEKLPGNVVRESRFDKLIEIKNPTKEQRKIYLEHLLKTEVSEEVLEKTKDFSVATLRELVITSKFKNTPLLEVINMKQKRNKLISKNFAKSTGSIGISSYGSEDTEGSIY